MPTIIDFYTLLPLHSDDGVRYPRVTSPYGPRGSGFHYGTDIGGGWRYRGFPTPVPADSTVTFIEHNHSSYGHRVIYRIDGTNYQILIAHLHTIDVRVGQKLKTGESIGGMGTTGNSTGEHWHIEIRTLPEAGKAPNQTTRLGDPEKFKINLPTDRIQYTVKDGDRLHVIATKYNTTVEQLIEWNNISDPNRIYAGQVLWVTGEEEDPTPPPEVPEDPREELPKEEKTGQILYTVTKIPGVKDIQSVIINGKGYVKAREIAPLLKMKAVLDTKENEIVFIQPTQPRRGPGGIM